MIRRAIAALGRSLIAVGVLLLLFVVYQLWGTGIAEARSQRSLRRDLAAEFGIDAKLLNRLGEDPAVTLPAFTAAAPDEASIPELPDVTVPGLAVGPRAAAGKDSDPATVTPRAGSVSAVPGPTAAPTTTVFRSKRPQLALRPGQAIGIIRIPRIHVAKAFLEGTAVEDLKHGPGHYTGTKLPGEPGLAAIAGHRTTYGNPFFDLDKMKPGDPIFVASGLGVFRYNTIGLKVVKPNDSSVLDDDGTKNLLVLTTCNPKFSASQRLILIAELVGPGVSADLVEPTTIPRITAVPATSPTTIPVSTGPTPTVPVTTVALTASATIPSGGPLNTAAEITTIPFPPEPLPDNLSPPSAASPASPDTVAPDRSGQRSSTIQVENRRYAFGWLSGSASAWRSTIVWTAVCAALWIGAWLLARRRRPFFQRFGIYIAGVLPFLLALYFCYENLARLLPENI